MLPVVRDAADWMLCGCADWYNCPLLLPDTPSTEVLHIAKTALPLLYARLAAASLACLLPARIPDAQVHLSLLC